MFTDLRVCSSHIQARTSRLILLLSRNIIHHYRPEACFTKATFSRRLSWARTTNIITPFTSHLALSLRALFGHISTLSTKARSLTIHLKGYTAFPQNAVQTYNIHIFHLFHFSDSSNTQAVYRYCRIGEASTISGIHNARRHKLS